MANTSSFRELLIDLKLVFGKWVSGRDAYAVEVIPIYRGHWEDNTEGERIWVGRFLRSFFATLLCPKDHANVSQFVGKYSSFPA